MSSTSAGWIPYLMAPRSAVGMATISDPRVPQEEARRRDTALPKDDDDGLGPLPNPDSSLTLLLVPISMITSYANKIDVLDV
jgi:hypothetical protein